MFVSSMLYIPERRLRAALNNKCLVSAVASLSLIRNVGTVALMSLKSRSNRSLNFFNAPRGNPGVPPPPLRGLAPF